MFHIADMAIPCDSVFNFNEASRILALFNSGFFFNTYFQIGSFFSKPIVPGIINKYVLTKVPLPAVRPANMRFHSEFPVSAPL